MHLFVDPEQEYTTKHQTFYKWVDMKLGEQNVPPKKPEEI